MERGNRGQERVRERSERSRRVGRGTQRHQGTMVAENLRRDAIQDNMEGSRESPSTRGRPGSIIGDSRYNHYCKWKESLRKRLASRWEK
jgi:hypothetical protein